MQKVSNDIMCGCFEKKPEISSEFISSIVLIQNHLKPTNANVKNDNYRLGKERAREGIKNTWMFIHHHGNVAVNMLVMISTKERNQLCIQCCIKCVRMVIKEFYISVAIPIILPHFYCLYAVHTGTAIHGSCKILKILLRAECTADDVKRQKSSV